MRVRPGLNSLENALQEAKRKGIDCLFLLNGVHTNEIFKDEDGDDHDSVFINFALKIVGQNRDYVKIKGSLSLWGKKEEDV